MSLIAWSGGCDSTCLLHQLATNDAYNSPLRTISINHYACNKQQNILQRHARIKILQWFNKRGIEIDHLEVIITSTTVHQKKEDIQIVNDGNMMQPFIWIPTASMYLQNNEDLYVGYVRGDDIWHYRTQICDLFNTMKMMTYKHGNLNFFFEWKRKREVISELKKIGLYDLTWYCESPKRKRPCGQCHPCRIHQLTLKELE